MSRAGGDRRASSARRRRCARRNVFAFNLPPIIGLGTGGGFEYQLAEPGRPRRRRNSAAAMLGLIVAANQDPRLTRGLLHLHGDQPVAVPRHRPRQGAGARAVASTTSSPRCRRRWAASTSTTSTCSAAPGRSTCRPRRPTATTSPTSGASMCATRAARWCRCARSPMCSIVLGPQTIIRYNNYRASRSTARRAPGVSSGDALAAMEALSRARAAARLRLRMDRHGLPGEAGLGADRHHPRAGGAVRLPVPGRRCTNPGSSRCRCCCRSRSACWRPSAR